MLESLERQVDNVILATFASDGKAAGSTSGVIPANTFALFFGDFFCHGECLGPAILADSGEDGIHQNHGSSIRRTVGSGFDGGQEQLVTNARERRNVCICNADAVSAVCPGLLGAVD